MNDKFQELLKEFKKLDLPNREYAIYGSGPIVVRGLRETGDLDVIVTESLYKKLAKKYGEDEKYQKGRRIKIGNIEIYAVAYWEAETEKLAQALQNAEKINGLRYVALTDLIDLKKKMGREKDLKDIKLIKGFLKR